MTDERTKSMDERVDHIRDENARMARFDSDRELPVGVLSPRRRLAALLDQDSMVELARLAHSQQEQVASTTVGDGVIIGYGTVHDQPVAIICEDPVALADTDAQVAKNKRLRLIDHAIFRQLPVIYLADGAPAQARTYAPGEGLLIARIADQRGARDVDERTGPFVAMVLGRCSGSEAELVSRADLVIATPSGRLGAGAGSLAPDDFADVVAPDDQAAATAARHAIDMLLRPRAGEHSMIDAADPLDDRVQTCPPERFLDGIVDDGSRLTLAASPNLVTAMARIGGHSVTMVVTGGGDVAELSDADLRRIERVSALSDRFGVPLLVTQDCAGYGDGECGVGHVRLIGELAARLRATRAVKITLVTGVGRVLGDYLLGGAGLAFDFTWAWPGARVPLREADAFASPETDGPWDAADFGILDDVIKPSETRQALAAALRLMAPCRDLPIQHLDRGQLIYDVV